MSIRVFAAFATAAALAGTSWVVFAQTSRDLQAQRAQQAATDGAIAAQKGQAAQVQADTNALKEERATCRQEVGAARAACQRQIQAGKARKESDVAAFQAAKATHQADAAALKADRQRMKAAQQQ